MALIKVDDHYESSDRRYTVTHKTGYKTINEGHLSRKKKRDEWEVKDRQEHKRFDFPSLKLAEHFILTGEYRAF